MDRRYLKLKTKIFIRSLLFGWYFAIKKRSNPKINRIISEVQKFGITEIKDIFTDTQLEEIKKR